jgi:PAS domain S-box-containing protein
LELDPAPLHKLLERQLKRHFGSLDAVPPGLRPLLESVSRSYAESDSDRQLVERSLELTSQELLQRNAALRERERERQIIFDSVPAMIFYKDRDNRILDLNAPAAAAMGKPPEALRGAACEDLFPPEVAQALHDDDLEVIRSGQPKLGVVEAHPAGDGKMHWMRTDKVPYRDDKGRVQGVIVLSVDITGRRDAEEALRASEERYRLIVETATEGIWMLDPHGRTTFANSVLASILGYEREEMLGRPLVDFKRPEDVEAGRLKVEALLAGARSADFRFRRKDGGDVWTQLSAAPMLDEQGKTIGVLAMVTDISKRRDAEMKLRDAYARLQQVDKERTMFLNNAAHELGTPLTPIRLQIHLLRTRGSTTPEQARTVDILERNFERLTHLVRDLLDSARLQAANLRLQLEPLDLREAVYQSVENYLAPANEAGVLIALQEMGPLPVTADRGRLGQVFDNLLSNAVKFTPRGARIHVSARRDGPSALVSVRDEGAGMRPQDLERLFRPFSQVHDTMQATRGGTGLGLYISRGIMEAHGGTITAASEGLGQGSTFTVRIPLAPRPPAEQGTHGGAGAP